MHHHKPVFPSREVGPVYKPAQSDDAIDNTPRQAGPAENLHSADFVGCVLADAILDDFVGQGQYSIQNGEHLEYVHHDGLQDAGQYTHQRFGNPIARRYLL